MRRARGFTLVEVLVALMVMAVMAAMAWQGIDGIARSRSVAEGRVDRMLRLSSVVAQWEQDLAQMQRSDVVSAIEFDGVTLRLTRRSETGLQVIAWALRDNAWLRWAAPPATSKRELQSYWDRAAQLLAGDAGQLRTIEGVAQWQLYYYRGNAWTNAQSSAGSDDGSTAAVAQVLPDGVRVVLSFAPASGLQGTLTRDVALALRR